MCLLVYMYQVHEHPPGRPEESIMSFDTGVLPDMGSQNKPRSSAKVGSHLSSSLNFIFD